MISQLTGKIVRKKRTHIILEVGGVGYQIFCNEKTLNELKEEAEATLYTHHHVKEDLQELYGFLNLPELELFKNVIAISGIGPKTGLAVLAVASVEDIIQAILSENPGLLRTVSGIGTKTAERLVVELKSKIGSLSKEITDKDLTTAMPDSDVIEALIGLGYSRKEVMEVVRQISKDLTETQDKIKGALKLLGKR